MDHTLRQYLALADSIHNNVDHYAVALNINQLQNMVNKLQLGIKTIQSVAKRMADINNVVNRVMQYKKATIFKLKTDKTTIDKIIDKTAIDKTAIDKTAIDKTANNKTIVDKTIADKTTADKSLNKTKKVENKVAEINDNNKIADNIQIDFLKHEIVDPYPSENDCAILRVLYPLKEESKELLDGIVLPVRIVQKATDIPVSPIYYIRELKQYAININGVVIKGNLGNITEYQTKYSARCDYSTECKSFITGKPCNYYHDVEDYVKLNLPIPDIIRNFTIGSFIYSRNLRPKTYFTRHVGSYDTLATDLQNLRKIQYREEISNREGQLIHDLLIYMILHSKGLLERYPHFGKIDLTWYIKYKSYLLYRLILLINS